MKIPLVDLKAQYNAIKKETDEAIQRVIDSTQFILGPEVAAFEAEVAAYCGTKFAVGVGSGTDALYLALLSGGIGPGDEVITTPFTFIATAESISRCGATPVFADIDPVTYNLNPADIAPRINRRTRAILPVHLYGQPADMDGIMELAREHHLMVIEDCAQAIGAEYRGKRVGSLGDAGCLSFFPSKGLGAYGDGGMVVTSNPEIAAKASVLRKHGVSKGGYYYSMHGLNSRLDALQAAILRVKLKHLEDWNRQRREKAALYARYLSPIGNLVLPGEPEHSLPSFNYYTLRLKDKTVDRAGLRQHLEAGGIQTMVYYPLSLHLQEVYQPLGYKPGDMPHSELAQELVLSLPIYPELSEGQIGAIADSMAGFLGQ